MSDKKVVIIFRIIKHILKSYVLLLWYYLYKPYRDKKKEEAKRRIKICEKCEYFDRSFRICSLCGCFMDVKSKTDNIEDCFAGKW
jgi:uncharacterized paraquat-inducible protein A